MNCEKFIQSQINFDGEAPIDTNMMGSLQNNAHPQSPHENGMRSDAKDPMFGGGDAEVINEAVSSIEDRICRIDFA